MAYYRTVLVSTSSIENIVDSFENRDKKGHRIYSRLLLDIPTYLGFVYLKRTLVIKRRFVVVNSNRADLTFSNLKSVVANCHFLYGDQHPLFQEINSYTKKYQEYVTNKHHEGIYKVDPKEYAFSKEYTLLTRGTGDRYNRKYGECISYKICGIVIKPIY